MWKCPVIGIINLGDEPFRAEYKKKYFLSVLRSGGNPIFINWDYDEEQMNKMINACDGFVFPGGGDVEPSLFGEKKSPFCGEPNYERDRMELPFLKKAIAADKPILGICKGAQLINIVMGGSLYQDINMQFACPCIEHNCPENKEKHQHSVKIASNSLLKKIVGKSTIWVNSMHHQGIKNVGKGLTVSANSRDMLTEAVENKESSFLLGVQWHPEWLQDEASYKIFDYFIQRCRRIP